MKAISTLIAIGLLANIAMAQTGSKKPFTCQPAAEKAAVIEMDRMNTEGLTDDQGKPRPLSDVEKAYVDTADITFVDADGNDSKVDTGIYLIPMTVMEECLDSMKVTTQKSGDKDQPSCQVIKVEPYGDRDCG